MKKHLSRLLIMGEIVVLIGILLIGLVGGIGTLGTYLFEKVASWSNSRSEAAAENTESGKKVTFNWLGKDNDSDAEETAATESLLAEITTETEGVTEVVSGNDDLVEKAVYTESQITFSAEVEAAIAAMTPEQQAGQLLLVNTEELLGIYDANKAGSTTESIYSKYPVGGILLTKDNCNFTGQLQEMTAGLEKFSETYAGTSLFLMTDEIGGSAHSSMADLTGTGQPGSPSSLGSQGAAAVTDAASAKAAYLKNLGFNLNIGTMTSLTGDDNSYGTDPAVVSELVKADLTAMQTGGVTSVVCTFPWSETKADTSAFSDLMAGDLSVFQAAAEGGAQVIMVGDSTVAAISGSDPCFLSSGSADVLRGNMGYEGILMTSSLSESSVKDQNSGDLAVKAINAGMDIVYSPSSLSDAYNGILSAIKDGTISEVRLHNALGRILTLKAGNE